MPFQYFGDLFRRPQVGFRIEHGSAFFARYADPGEPLAHGKCGFDAFLDGHFTDTLDFGTNYLWSDNKYPTSARKLIVPDGADCVVRVISRCVRRAWLCGQDPLTGKDFEHRRDWVRF